MQDSLTRWRAFSSTDERVGHDSRGYTTGACVIIRGIHLLLFGADVQWRETCRRPTATLFLEPAEETGTGTKCPSASNKLWLLCICRHISRSKNEWSAFYSWHCSVFKYTALILPLPFPFWDVKNMCTSGVMWCHSSKTETSIISIFGYLRESHVPMMITLCLSLHPLPFFTRTRCNSWQAAIMKVGPRCRAEY